MRPTFDADFVSRPITPRQAQALGQPKRDAVIVPEHWFTVPLDRNWVVAYRLMPTGDRVLVSEARVFPRERNPLPDLRPGEWSGTLRRPSTERIGRGITARLLHRATIGEHLYTLLPPAVQKKRDDIARGPWGERGNQVLDEFGIDAFGFTGAAPRPSKRGPKGRPDRFFAALARAYVERCKSRSRSPIADVATARKLKPSVVRDDIHEARRRGLLTRGKQGGAGGVLTPAGERALKTRSRRLKSKQRS